MPDATIANIHEGNAVNFQLSSVAHFHVFKIEHGEYFQLSLKFGV